VDVSGSSWLTSSPVTGFPIPPVVGLLPPGIVFHPATERCYGVFELGRWTVLLDCSIATRRTAAHYCAWHLREYWVLPAPGSIISGSAPAASRCSTWLRRLRTVGPHASSGELALFPRRRRLSSCWPYCRKRSGPPSLALVRRCRMRAAGTRRGAGCAHEDRACRRTLLTLRPLLAFRSAASFSVHAAPPCTEFFTAFPSAPALLPR